MPLPELIEIVPFSKEQLRSFQWKKAEIMVPGSKSSWAIYTILSSEKFIVFAGCFFCCFGVGIGVLLEHLWQKRTDGCVCACVGFGIFRLAPLNFMNSTSLGQTLAVWAPQEPFTKCFSFQFFWGEGSFQEEKWWSWGITNRATCLAKQFFLWDAFLSWWWGLFLCQSRAPLFVGRFGLDFFEYFAEVRLGTCNEWNGMYLSGFCV